MIRAPKPVEPKKPGHVRPRKNALGQITSYEARLPDPVRKTAGGNQIIHLQSFDTAEDAFKWLDKKRVELAENGEIAIPSTQTVSQSCANWLEEVAIEGADRRGSIRTSTLNNYKNHIEKYVDADLCCQKADGCKPGCVGVPKLGTKLVQQLTPRMLQKWAMALAREKGRDLAKRVLRDVKAALSTAAMDLLLPDVWKNVKLARDRHADGGVEIVIQTDEAKLMMEGARQLRDLGNIKGADGEILMLPGEASYASRVLHGNFEKRKIAWARWAPLVWLLFRAGIRIGEGLALQWKHFDFEKKQVRVEQTLSNACREIAETKTASGKRFLALDDETVEVLLAYRDWCRQSPPKKKNAPPRRRTDQEAYVFGTNRGDKWDNRSNFRRAWDMLCSMHPSLLHPDGGSWASPHDARHWHASFLIESGVPLADVSARLGHSSTQVTAQIYVHALGNRDERDRNAADVFGSAMRS